MILKNHPTLDVHGETSSTVVFIVKDFLKDNYSMKKRTIVIIHGKGYGILRKKVHEILKHSPYVETYQLDGMNIGATEVTLKKRSEFDKY